MSLGCSLCNARCCKNLLITITSFDVLKLQRHTGKKAQEFAELVEPRVLRIDWSTVLDCIEGSYVLALKSRPCVFLKNNGCDVYEKAPLTCKVYPSGFNDFVDMPLCPTQSKVIFRLNNPGSKYLGQMKKELNEYRKIVQALNHQKPARKDCFDALMEITQEVVQEHPAIFL